MDSALAIIVTGAVELGLIYSLMALGLFTSYRILGLADLTVDGSFTTGCAVSGVVTAAGRPLLGLLLAIPAGALAGLITSLLQTKLRVQSILAGILTMTFLYSVNLRIMGGKPNIALLGKATVFSSSAALLPEGLARFAKYPVILLIVALACALLFVFLRTQTGLVVRATGDNVDMVRSSSINPDLTNAIGLCIANALVALSGGVLAQYQQFADIGLGTGMVVIGLASLIIGEVLVGRRSMGRHILAVVAGSIAYRLVIALALQSTSAASDLKAISAIIVAIAISAPAVKDLWGTWRLRRAGALQDRQDGKEAENHA